MPSCHAEGMENRIKSDCAVREVASACLISSKCSRVPQNPNPEG